MTSSGTYNDCESAIKVSIYIARNLVNGGEYIGITSGGIKKRRREHLCSARTGSNLYFHNAIRKYGEESFSFIEIETVCDYSAALKRERELIAERKPKYNLTAGGEGVFGFKMPADVVAKIAEQKRGKPGPWRGKKRSEETKAKIRAKRIAHPTRYWLGKTRSLETIEKIKASKTGVPRKSPAAHVLEIFIENMRRAAKARRRKVICVDDGLVFESASEAATHYGFKALSINRVCNADGHRKSLFGKRFKYMEERK